MQDQASDAAPRMAHVSGVLSKSGLDVKKQDERVQLHGSF